VIVDEQFGECVACLYIDIANIAGKVERTPSGTRFFVLVKHDGVDVGNILTARHFINRSQDDVDLYIRVNLATGGFEDRNVSQNAPDGTLTWEFRFALGVPDLALANVALRLP